MLDEEAIGAKFQMLVGQLDERAMRLWAAAEAQSHGRGGTGAVARATGIAESTIRRGRLELASGSSPGPGRVRRPGAGRKPLTEKDPALLPDLERLVDPEARGDPCRPLRWTAKSLRTLADELVAQGHQISARSVAPLLRRLGYCLQANRKTREGASHPDRDAQFRHINAVVGAALDAGEPAIWVDTKKKELVGDFKNGGASCAPRAPRSRCARTTFAIRTRPSARPLPMGSMTSPRMPALSASGSTTTPPSSPSPRSAAGGRSSAASATRTPRR